MKNFLAYKEFLLQDIVNFTEFKLLTSYYNNFHIVFLKFI
jgi:hypothetical protein